MCHPHIPASSSRPQQPKAGKDPESLLPLPRHQHRYTAHDCAVQEEGGVWDPEAVPAPTPLLGGDHSSSSAPSCAPTEERTASVTLHAAEETKNLMGSTV